MPCCVAQVLRIERVQNAKLWRRYCLKREELVDARGEAGAAANLGLLSAAASIWISILSNFFCHNRDAVGPISAA